MQMDKPTMETSLQSTSLDYAEKLAVSRPRSSGIPHICSLPNVQRNLFPVYTGQPIYGGWCVLEHPIFGAYVLIYRSPRLNHQQGFLPSASDTGCFIAFLHCRGLHP